MRVKFEGIVSGVADEILESGTIPGVRALLLSPARRGRAGSPPDGPGRVSEPACASPAQDQAEEDTKLATAGWVSLVAGDGSKLLEPVKARKKSKAKVSAPHPPLTVAAPV